MTRSGVHRDCEWGGGKRRIGAGECFDARLELLDVLSTGWNLLGVGQMRQEAMQVSRVVLVILISHKAIHGPRTLSIGHLPLPKVP